MKQNLACITAATVVGFVGLIYCLHNSCDSACRGDVARRFCLKNKDFFEKQYSITYELKSCEPFSIFGKSHPIILMQINPRLDVTVRISNGIVERVSVSDYRLQFTPPVAYNVVNGCCSNCAPMITFCGIFAIDLMNQCRAVSFEVVVVPES